MHMGIHIKDKQLEFLDWEFGAFFHFGIRTFYEGHRDWDMQEMPLSGFAPSALDCNQWIETIKAAGARYAILVCKHHDGFANWPSAYTGYSVAGTPWKGGKGDVVREFTDACRRYDIKVGLYYSPAEFGSNKKSAREYDEYFINQISELLTGYGKIDYLWFDGNGSEGHQYDTARITGVIRTLQPEILIFNMWDPDTRWVGNESGYAHSPNLNVVNQHSFSVFTDIPEAAPQDRFLPVECDFRMRLSNWFYSDTDGHTVKSLDELMGIYYYTVGRGANMLINIGPDRRGLLPDGDAKRLLEFGDEIRRRFSRPLTDVFVYTDGSYISELPEPALISHVVLAESLEPEAIKEPVTGFTIRASNGSPILVYEGKTIGHKAICQFPPFFTQKIEVTLTTAGGTAGQGRLRSLALYR
ncbi:alpha-L-fucosidase [Spirochaetia bacterium]|nr:alpha-L-fucosidase [Spirochaetia bacterium]